VKTPVSKFAFQTQPAALQRGAMVGNKTTVGTALLANILDYNDSCLHTVGRCTLESS
jgi:hypothetical protein